MPLSSPRWPDYIPLGCLILPSKSNRKLNEEYFSSENFHRWHILLPQPAAPDELAADEPVSIFPFDKQANFLKALKIPLNKLFDAQWVKFEYKVATLHGETFGILRVYVLPDDVRHILIDRADATLQRTRKALMSSLDYALETWLGNPAAEPLSFPRPHNAAEAKEVTSSTTPSLLEMFNNITAPNPVADQARDAYVRYAVNSLLESDVEGLNSCLYPYQRRSAATMVLREVQPEQFLDPRLTHVKDQHDRTWYYDVPANVICREPSYYEGVRGGILAEQMGAGKTVICLSLILATRSTPTPPPPHRTLVRPKRRPKGVASLADMAAACVTRHGLPYRWQFDAGGNHSKYTRCLQALERNPGAYEVPTRDDVRSLGMRSRRVLRRPMSHDYRPPEPKAQVVLISQASFITVPQNLMQQWQQEIAKHTTGLKVLVLDQKNHREVLKAKRLAEHDIVLCSHSRLESMVRNQPTGPMVHSGLTHVYFKRCIVDEGHRLGNSSINSRSDFHRGLDTLHAASRWIVTGTPSRGLYGVDDALDEQNNNASTHDQEKWDLEKLGSIAKLYLKARPWANTYEEGERLADWRTYVMQPMYHVEGANRHSSTLRETLNALIIRHPLSQLTHMYPSVEEKVTVLEGSYQDKLALDIFSMVIIFNSVQSQRTDMDYFFHPRQRTALLQLVNNLKLASFFGGGFFSRKDLTTSLDTAKTFLRDKPFTISDEDDALIRSAVSLGEIAIKNAVKQCSNDHHEVPLLIKDFLPGAAAVAAWSFDIGQKDDHRVCTDATLVVAAQKLIRAALHDQAALNTLLNGQLIDKGILEKSSADDDEAKIAAQSEERGTLAGNTKLGENRSSTKIRTNALKQDLAARVEADTEVPENEVELPEEFRKAQLVATASAKMTYLLDSIIEHQTEEQIIIFYENDNTAFYVAGMLDVIQVPYLIYDKSLKLERKAQYIHTFNNDDKFRVLLMDIGQAAYGLDMRAASRIYFLTPVLNPQVQAQAIGRVRRISQQKPVSVETLVLRGSIEEVIVQRKSSMSAAEHWRVKSLIDDRPIYEWIRNARIRFGADADSEPLEQFAPLRHPQPVFGKSFGREAHPDADIMDVHAPTKGAAAAEQANGVKRPGEGEVVEPPARRVRFA